MPSYFSNPRASYPTMFGDSETQELFERECEEARRAQRVPYALAPKQVLKLHDGRQLKAGDEVKLDDFITQPHPVGSPQIQLEKLIRRGIVLDKL